MPAKTHARRRRAVNAPTARKRVSIQELRRLQDWASRLHAFLQDPGEPGWGKSDCCLFVCDAVRAMTGVDLATGIRGGYASEREAKRIIARKGGFEAMIDAIAKRHRIAEVPVAFARRGDVVLAIAEGGPTLMLVDLNGREILGRAFSSSQLVRRPLRSAKRAWRIA